MSNNQATTVVAASKIGAYFSILRLPNCFMIGLAVIIGESIAAGGFPDVEKAILGFFAAFLLLAGTMVLNDIHDVETDRINMPNRPIPSGRVKISQAYLLVIVFSILGILSSAFLGLATLLIGLTCLIDQSHRAV